ncbi:MAG: hypothetical protein Q4B42_02655 [Oscillospiraceae bacterium]|nr:hypothetical protein [Oscillospiraceae bacterium]
MREKKRASRPPRKRQKPQKKSGSPLRFLRAFFVGLLSLAAALLCGWLVYFFQSNGFLPTDTRLLIQLMCLAGAAASLSLGISYIKALYEAREPEEESAGKDLT